MLNAAAAPSLTAPQWLSHLLATVQATPLALCREVGPFPRAQGGRYLTLLDKGGLRSASWLITLPFKATNARIHHTPLVSARRVLL